MNTWESKTTFLSILIGFAIVVILIGNTVGKKQDIRKKAVESNSPQLVAVANLQRFYVHIAGKGCILSKNSYYLVEDCTNTPPAGTCYNTKAECDAANGAHHYYVFFPDKGCIYSKNTFPSVEVCTRTPPAGTCYVTEEECKSANFPSITPSPNPTPTPTTITTPTSTPTSPVSSPTPTPTRIPTRTPTPIPTTAANHYYVYFPDRGCIYSKNTFPSVEVCTRTPPAGTCYNTKTECEAAHSHTGPTPTQRITPTPPSESRSVVLKNGDIGVDISSHDGAINFKTLKSKVKFVIIRATYGLSIDTKFNTNWSGAKSVGLSRSAYYFFRCNNDPKTGAKLFAGLTGKLNSNGTYTYEGDFMPFIDMEDEYTLQGCSKETLTRRTVEFMNEFHRLTGVWPGLYSRASWYDIYLIRSYLPGTWAFDITEWNASWSSLGMSSVTHMREWRFAYPGSRGQKFFWQYKILTSGMSEYGSSGGWLDMNRYVGPDLVFP